VYFATLVNAGMCLCLCLCVRYPFKEEGVSQGQEMDVHLQHRRTVPRAVEEEQELTQR